ncbi:hypothetical protein [Paraburkholderia panacisoli]|uniref:hypothetical protein n=1 Tax=Paraburkholderia panacisoli TaxID=2603818 RepID=UPI001FED147D|nr:hypothetical protein [Paraburkholderia panacisoli]
MQQVVQLLAGVGPCLPNVANQRFLGGVDGVQLVWVDHATVHYGARGIAKGFNRLPHLLDRWPERHMKAWVGRSRFGEIGAQVLKHGVELTFQHKIARAHLVVRSRTVRCAVQLPTDSVNGIEQCRIAQNRQRHRVIAVEVRIQNQIRLVAHARDKFATRFKRFAHGCRRGFRLVRQHLECRTHASVRRGTLHVDAVKAFSIGETNRGVSQRGCGGALAGAGEGDVDQRVAYSAHIGIADDFLVREIDADIFLMYQNAADVKDGAQIQQIDEQEFSTHAKACEKPKEEIALHR